MKFNYTIKKTAKTNLPTLVNKIKATLKEYRYNIVHISDNVIEFDSDGWGIGLRSQQANKVSRGAFKISDLDEKTLSVELEYTISYTKQIIFISILVLSGFIGNQLLSLGTASFIYQALFIGVVLSILVTISFFGTKTTIENMFDEIIVGLPKNL
jgi:hypothetical protein